MGFLGNLFSGSYGGPPGMSEEEDAWLRKQQRSALLSRLAAASAPSRDPRSSSLGYALSQGVEGMQGATSAGMNQLMAQDRFNTMRNERKLKETNRKALSDIPMNRPVKPPMGGPSPMQGPPSMQGPFTPQQTKPRGMGDYLKDYVTTAMKQGDMSRAGQAASLIPKVTQKTQDLPYKLGSRQRFIGGGGKQYEGTFGGLTPEGLPNWKDKIEIPKEKQGVKGETVFKQAQGLRKEYIGAASDYRKIRDSYARVQESAKEPSAAGDLALIFNYMKMLDPGSVVRESEFATAASSGAFGERIQAAGLKIIEGQRLSPAMREDFEARANMLQKRQTAQHGKRKDEYSRLAKSFDIDPKRVIVDLEDPVIEEQFRLEQQTQRPLPQF